MSNIHNIGTTQPLRRPALNASDFKDILCTKCNGDLFLESYKFKRVSKLLVGTDKDQIVPIKVYVCTNCGTLLNELLPKDVSVSGRAK